MCVCNITRYVKLITFCKILRNSLSNRESNMERVIFMLCQESMMILLDTIDYSKIFCD